MSRARSLLALALALLAGACAAPTESSPAPESGYVIAGYVMGSADLPSISANKLTHLIYAFAKVSPEGVVVLPDSADPANIAQLQALKAENPALKVLVSVGGWGADHFSDAALTPESRARFARSAADLVDRYSLDGIDVDWEYPGQPGPGIGYRPEDRENFTLMLQTVRAQLDSLGAVRGRTGADHYLLTVASAAWKYMDHVQIGQAAHYVDWFNVMSYDYFGGSSKITGHHTGLYGSTRSTDPGWNAAEAVRQYLAAGVPSRKIVVGSAFYGHGWTGVNPTDNGLNQPFTGTLSGLSYARIESDYLHQPGFERRWDAEAHAPYLWNAATRTLISYDDPQSIADKAAFVKEHHLRGLMFWQWGHDPDEVLLDAMGKGLSVGSR